eukprot:GHUV01024864.1.p1 GENE.GHUV01024864.1~~GHUV01024864.1.p1  ORF type:complete len:163 (+),score=50.77 GHUV01024864.1:211-699(+)
MQKAAHQPAVSRIGRATSVRPMALFGRKASAAVVDKPKTTQQTTSSKKTESSKPLPKQSFMSQTLDAFDFAEVRSKKDAELLYEAKYGKRGEDGKMTREQYMALRRKIGGTARDYWKDWIEVDEVKPTGFATKPASVPYLPFLVGVLVAMLGVTVLVVQQTS